MGIIIEKFDNALFSSLLLLMKLFLGVRLADEMRLIIGGSGNGDVA